MKHDLLSRLNSRFCAILDTHDTHCPEDFDLVAEVAAALAAPVVVGPLTAEFDRDGAAIQIVSALIVGAAVHGTRVIDDDAAAEAAYQVADALKRARGAAPCV